MSSILPQRTRMLSVAAVVGATLLFLLVAGCESRTDKTDGGGVLLSVTEFDGLPVLVSVNDVVDNNSALVQVDEITIENIAKDPGGATSSLMNVEIDSYEIRFSRADTGTRLPPPLVRNLFGVIPVNGNDQIENLPIMTSEQLLVSPLSDLLLENGGVDLETGGQNILLNLSLRFFGRTLSGDEVETGTESFTVEFTR